MIFMIFELSVYICFSEYGYRIYYPWYIYIHIHIYKKINTNIEIRISLLYAAFAVLEWYVDNEVGFFSLSRGGSSNGGCCYMACSLDASRLLMS